MTTRKHRPSRGSDAPNAKGPVKEPSDRLLFLLTVLLLGVGIVTVFDASYALGADKGRDLFHYVRLQTIWAVVGIGALAIGWRVPYWVWRRYAIGGLGVTLLLLVAVWAPFLGHRANGAGRWVGISAFHLQPSELAKLMLILYLARVLAVGPKTMRRFQTGAAPPLLIILLLAALIAAEPDMGTALVLAGTGLTMLFVAGARPRHLAAVCLPISLLAGAYMLISPRHRTHLLVWLNPKSDALNHGYQNWHALIAMGSGGLTGLGLGEGREKLYIPEGHTDFIFPVFGEEWGLVGTLTLVTVFLLIAMRGYSIAHRTKDPFGALLAAGLTTMVSLQAIVNMAVATGSIPNTGVPLPFISYGGTSLVLMLAGVGVLLNISSYPNGPGRPDQDRIPPNERDWERRWGPRDYLRDPPAAPTAPAKRKARPKAQV